MAEFGDNSSLTVVNKEGNPAKVESFSASPFADRVTSVEVEHSKLARKRRLLFIAISASLAVALAAIVFLTMSRDPLRTLPQFPTVDYFSNYNALVGTNFRADLVVDSELGWDKESGRLMSFKATPEDRPLAVIIPPAIADEYFVKGRNYEARVTVREDGAVVADKLFRN